MTPAAIIQEALKDVGDTHLVFGRLRNSGLNTEQSCQALAGAGIKFDARVIDARVTTVDDEHRSYGFTR